LGSEEKRQEDDRQSYKKTEGRNHSGRPKKAFATHEGPLGGTEKSWQKVASLTTDRRPILSGKDLSVVQLGFAIFCLVPQ
jgi:hypothetical protein